MVGGTPGPTAPWPAPPPSICWPCKALIIVLPASNGLLSVAFNILLETVPCDVTTSRYLFTDFPIFVPCDNLLAPASHPTPGIAEAADSAASPQLPSLAYHTALATSAKFP